jgi:MFS family permease
LGGYLIEVASWRLLFYMNIPIGLIAIFLAITNMSETEKISTAHVDTAGIVTISIGLFCLLLALSKGNTMGWSDPVIVIMIFVGVVNMIIMAIHELRTAEPVLDISLFKNATFALSVVCMRLIICSQFLCKTYSGKLPC